MSSVVISDLREALQRFYAAAFFGWDDIRQQYKRTMLGPIWLSFGTCAWIFGMAFVMSAMFNKEVGEFLPHTAAGMFVWSFFGMALVDGCNTFIKAGGLIHSMRLPLFFHALRALIRYSLLYFHYLVVAIILMILIGSPPTWMALLALPAILIQILTVFGIILIMGLLNARYRDLMPITGVLCQLMPLMTPIAWQRSMLQKHTWIADFNPFYHLIEIVRAPLLGHVPETLSYLVALGTMLLMLLLGLWRYRLARYKLIFWV